MKTIIAACSAAACALAGVPAAAQHYTDHGACEQWRNGRCISWHVTRGEATAVGFAVGHDFGPHYSYVDRGALPQTIVTRYHLGPEFRYVNQEGRVYVVNPHTYRVVRVITAS